MKVKITTIDLKCTDIKGYESKCSMMEIMMEKFDSMLRKMEQTFDKGEKDQARFEEKIGTGLHENKSSLEANLNSIK